MMLYKYQPISKLTLLNLRNNVNWVSDPFEFNDPFEFELQEPFYLNELGKIEHLIPKLHEKFEGAKHDIKKYGVVSFSAEEPFKNNHLLWSHYTDNHKGMCLVFDVGTDVTMHKVIYDDILPVLTNDYKSISFRNWLFNCLITKSKQWSYESEYRQLVAFKKQQVKYPGKLVEIIFGCRTPKTEMDFVVDLMNSKDDTISVSRTNIQKGTFFLSRSSFPINKKYIEITDHWGNSKFFKMIKFDVQYIIE